MCQRVVKVICRFRPINDRERKEQAKEGVSLQFTEASVHLSQPSKEPISFAFDNVFHDDCSQEDVFEKSAAETVDDVLKGYNGTIFAYGQTGAGKSFSMFGPDINDSNMRGIIPRACSRIFDTVRKTDGIEFSVLCSFLEIYREVIRDLLDPTKDNLKVRETPTRGVWVEGLSERSVKCEEDVIALLKEGEQFRSVAATLMNATSSRSHSLFIISVIQKARNGTTKIGKLNLADLAGSEKVNKTGAVGETLEEAKKINQSLSALGNCINALTKSRRTHVPYRDSKLTHVLKESLGGNAKTTLLIACSPHPFNLDETISTLRFGQRAKTIKNKVRVNQQRSVQELELIIQKLTADLKMFQQYARLLESEIEQLRGHDYDLEGLRKRLLAKASQFAQNSDILDGTSSNTSTPTKSTVESRPQSPDPSLALSPRGKPSSPSVVVSDDHSSSPAKGHRRNRSSELFVSAGQIRVRADSNPSPIPRGSSPSLNLKSLATKEPDAPESDWMSDDGNSSTANSPREQSALDALFSTSFDPMALVDTQLALESMKDEFALKIQDMQEEISKYKDQLSEAHVTETKLKADLELARAADLERQQEASGQIASLKKQVEDLQNQVKRLERESASGAAPSSANSDAVLPSALDPSRNLAVKLDFESVPLSFKNPALLATASPETANKLRARRSSVYESTVEYQLFNWMVLAIKLDFATRTQLIDAFDKYQLWDWIVENKAPSHDWPTLIIQALESNQEPAGSNSSSAPIQIQKS